MTLPSGEQPPRPGQDDPSEDSPTLPRRTPRRRASQANLWSEDGARVQPVAPGSETPAHAFEPPESDEVWASPQRPAARNPDSAAVVEDVPG